MCGLAKAALAGFGNIVTDLIWPPTIVLDSACVHITQFVKPKKQ